MEPNETFAEWHRRRHAVECPGFLAEWNRRRLAEWHRHRLAEWNRGRSAGEEIPSPADEEIPSSGREKIPTIEEARLRGANLTGALLVVGRLAGARLDGARLGFAYLAGARLAGADLRRADLREARLYGADLHGADLRGANLHGARLDKAINLTQEQLESARGDSETELPEGLVRPKSWERSDESERSRLMAVVRWPVIFTVLAVVVLSIWVGYNRYPVDSGFGGHWYDTTSGKEYRRPKTLWDWMDLLLIPAVLGILGSWGASWFNQRREKLGREIEERRRQEERERADRRSAGEALQKYLDSMTEPMLKELRISKPDDPSHDHEQNERVRVIARAKTLAALRELDRERKGTLLRFLYESELIIRSYGCKDKPTVELRDADFTGAKLFKIDLFKANLREIDLRKADLREADLHWADLTGARLFNADLGLAYLFKADLVEARLGGAYLGFADLRGAHLERAYLERTYLGFADLRDADLRDADLRDADLRGADLRKVKNLTQEQLVSACGDGETKLPQGLGRPAAWTTPPPAAPAGSVA